MSRLGRFDFLAPDALTAAVQAMNARAAEIRAAGGYVATEGDPLDRHSAGGRGPVRARYSPVVWPDEGYPCQLCWAVGRWPWEPMRSCPADVDPESTYCVDHGGQAAPPKPARPAAEPFTYEAYVRAQLRELSGLFQHPADWQQYAADVGPASAAGTVVEVNGVQVQVRLT